LILVDTSVLVDYFRGRENEKLKLFELVLSQKMPYGISAYTYLELLQGSKNDKEYTVLKEYLSTQTIYLLPETIETYEKAANAFYNLRRKGITPRSTIDVLIALTAIEHSLLLLHNDNDFDVFAEKIADLKILTKLV